MLSWFIIQYFLVFLFGLIAFAISTIIGGGGALLLLPVLSLIIYSKSLAPMVNLGVFIGRPVRLALFWNNIHWRIVWFYIPSSIIGAIIGGYAFSFLNAEWIKIILGLFLVSTLFQYKWGRTAKSFEVKVWHFIPLGLCISFISTIVGATGAIMNPFYLNYGLEKEQLIGTKTANSFFTGIFQIGSYSFFGALTTETIQLGIILGIGIAFGNYIGKKWLNRLTNLQFRKLVIFGMVLSGLTMMIKTIIANLK